MFFQHNLIFYIRNFNKINGQIFVEKSTMLSTEKEVLAYPQICSQTHALESGEH